MSVSSMTLIAGRIGMPMPSDQESTPFMPRSAWSVRLTQVNPTPSASGDDGDRDQVGRVRDPGAQRPVGDVVGGGRGWKRRSRSALVTTLTELIAIAALASTGSSSSPSHQYRAPAATGMSSTL